MLAAAQHAFTSGLHVTALIGAVAVVSLADTMTAGGQGTDSADG
jgi:hypothetical protein